MILSYEFHNDTSLMLYVPVEYAADSRTDQDTAWIIHGSQLNWSLDGDLSSQIASSESLLLNCCPSIICNQLQFM